MLWILLLEEPAELVDEVVVKLQLLKLFKPEKGRKEGHLEEVRQFNSVKHCGIKHTHTLRVLMSREGETKDLKDITTDGLID